MKQSTATANHYIWGQSCDGWPLLNTDRLSVIEERMPPGTHETLHLHHRAQRFFYVLQGTATFEVEGSTLTVEAREELNLHPGQQHKISNAGMEDLWFLVVSEPKAHGDRTNLE